MRNTDPVLKIIITRGDARVEIAVVVRQIYFKALC
jgi:hypothetical protein